MSTLITPAGHLGDFLQGAPVRFKFMSHLADGTPTSLSGIVISVYRDGSLTQITTDLTTIGDFDALTGLNDVIINPAFSTTEYIPGRQYTAYISTGTVGGVSCVGQPVASWTIERCMAGSKGGSPSLGWIDHGTAQGATSTTTTLRSDFSAPGAKGGTLFVWNSTNGKFQRVLVTTYDNTTKVCTHDAYEETPTGTIQYILFGTPSASAGQPIPANVLSMVSQALAAHVGGNFNTFWENGGNASTKIVDNVGTGGGGAGAYDSGTAQAISPSTITLKSGHGLSDTSAVLISLTGGTNAKGKSRIASFASGDQFNVDPPWDNGDTMPSGTITYEASACPPVQIATLPAVNVKQVDDEALPAGVAGYLPVDVKYVNGDPLHSPDTPGYMPATVRVGVEPGSIVTLAGVPYVNLKLLDDSAPAIVALKALFDGSAMVEPTGVPLDTDSFAEKVNFLLAFITHKRNQTLTQQALRNAGDSANIGVAPVSTVAGVATIGPFA